MLRTKEKDGNIYEILDTGDISDLRYEIYKIDKLLIGINSMANLSEFEEKYRKLFDHETKLVSSMDDLALKLHINELEDIARESRTRLTAAAGEAQKRKNSVRKILPALDGSIDSSSQFLATEAISNIEARAKKQNKQEKQIENMMSLLGMSREDAERMFSGSKILEIKADSGKKKEIKISQEIEVKTEPTAVEQTSTTIEEPSKSTFKSPFSKD